MTPVLFSRSPTFRTPPRHQNIRPRRPPAQPAILPPLQQLPKLLPTPPTQPIRTIPHAYPTNPALPRINQLQKLMPPPSNKPCQTHHHHHPPPSGSHTKQCRVRYIAPFLLCQTHLSMSRPKRKRPTQTTRPANHRPVATRPPALPYFLYFQGLAATCYPPPPSYFH